ncbi:MAG: hypothetical protein HFI74_05645 [Lachnospiraceae bacterium]|nr:hypothetical protein [Lachnospiraceae bacterium]
MRKRVVLPILLMLFLSLGIIQTQAQAGIIQEECVTMTEKNRYQGEYFKKPQVRYPTAQSRGYYVERTSISAEQYLVNAFMKMEAEIDVSAYDFTSEEFNTFLNQVVNNNAELFFVNISGMQWWTSGDKVSRLEAAYVGTAAEIAQQQEDFEDAVNKALERVDGSMSEVEKALVIHDYLIQLCEYDKERLSAGSLPAISHTAYGALVNKIAVCDGYAKAFAHIMDKKLGISCELVSSDKMNHAWNIIEIGGKWYHVDVTWDDPTWDCIGRTVHTYFLLSDDQIKVAGTGDKHEAWVTTRTADSDLYDDAFWADISSAFCYYQGEWYYAQKNSSSMTLNKRSELLTGEEETVYTSTDIWGGWQGCFTYLSQANGQIYLNTGTAIHRLNADGTVAKVYEPQIPENQKIFGFTIRGKNLCYALQDTPNLTAKQVVQTHELQELEVPEIEGIEAKDVQVPYDGQAHQITVTGTSEGDVIKFAGEDGTYGPNQPEMINVGEYQVFYQVERTGHQTFRGVAKVTIQKATPPYTKPADLTGVSGQALSTVELPEGFAWQSPTLKMRDTGKQKFLATYTPNDLENYEIVTGIELEVTVSCAQHDYQTVVNKQPTATEPGEMTLTCVICGFSKTEVIPAGQQVLTGIDANDVVCIYDGQPHGIIVTGIIEGDVVTYAATEDGEYQEEQPSMVNAGRYTVWYQVEREGFKTLKASATVLIQKAETSYTKPGNLTGISGQELSTVELPEGFAWQSPTLKMRETGKQKFLVDYTPEDSVNYESVKGIELEVTVSCPEHDYETVITKQPTPTEDGEKTHTCKLCGHIEKEIIPAGLPLLEGIGAGETEFTYNGQEKKITLTGTEADDVVTYAEEEDGEYQEEQPVLVNTGEYQVWVQIERPGFRPLRLKVDVVIHKGTPEYDTPQNLAGTSGMTLGEIELPEGFMWQTPENTKLREEGTQTFQVKYVPQDQNNYENVENIPVKVEVTCPGHDYESEITKEPTDTEDGIRTYTCKICGNTYEETFVQQQITGISAKDVEVTYNGQKHEITVNGTLPGDVVSYATREDGDYQENQPEMINAGVYQVWYQVQRKGHKTLHREAQVVIHKATPTYTAPTEVTRFVRGTLGDMPLPQHFEWQDDPGTKLTQLGQYTFRIQYVPEDSVNYKIVQNILVKVNVICSGHYYEQEVTKEPTEEEDGEITYTCIMCGDSYTMPIKLNLPQIEGLYADNLNVMFDGTAHKIIVQGLQNGDSIQYAREDGVYQDEQPVLVNAGMYQVWYRVKREGFHTFYGKVYVEIARAVPRYTVPKGLKGISGTTLSTIALPANFVWQEDTAQKLYQEGTHIFHVSYVPKDTLNYQTITDIPVEVEVSCPGHRYQSEIIVQPTETQKGLKVHTCTLCGETYEEELPMLVPVKPAAVSGLKVKKQTSNALTFSWKKVDGVKYRLILYKGNKKVSAKYISGNSYKFTKLVGSADYKLRVTPYREVNGKKIYAEKDKEVKTATAPGTVKLSSVKKSGKNKAKVTWKEIPGASGYEIYKKTGTSSYKKIKTITKGKTTSYTKTGLKKGKTYSFRVCAYKKIGEDSKLYGGNSKVKSLKLR